MKICPKCNAQYDYEMSFCLQDGSPLVVTNSTTEAKQKLSEVTQVRDDKTLQMGEKTLVLPERTDSPTEKLNFAKTEETQIKTESLKSNPPVRETFANQPKSRFGLLIGTILGVLALFTVGIGSFFYLQPSKNNEIVTGNSKSSVNNSNLYNSNVSEVSVNSNSGLTQNINAKPSPTISITPVNSNKPTPKPTEEKETTPTPKPTATPTPATPTPTPVETPAPNVNQIVNRGVLNGRATNLVKPPYPPAARASGVSGEVRVHVLVDENGNVVMARAVNGHPLLRASAESAARASKFNPALINGHQVKMNGVIVYNFTAQ